jgi:hypothetical protein
MGLTAITEERDEVMMAVTVAAFQSCCHAAKGNILQTHISKDEMWGTHTCRCSRADVGHPPTGGRFGSLGYP